MNEGKRKVRDSNFELLRTLSMFMIVILHIGTHGLAKYIGTSDSFSGLNELMYYFIRSLAIVAVSLYVLISGYFLSKSQFKLIKLINLFLEVSFFATVVYLVNVMYNLVIVKMIVYSVIIFICCWVLSFVLNSIYKAVYQKISGLKIFEKIRKI